MSTDQPPPGQPPEDDPFLKKPQEPTPPPSGGSPYGSPPAGAGGGFPPPPPGGGGGYPPPPPPGGGGYPPPPPPYGGPGGGDPYGGGGGYGMPDPLAGMPPLADFGKRLAARVIDLLIIAVPLFVIQLFAGDRNRYTVETNKGEDVTEVITKSYSGSGLVMTLISIVAYVGYDWWFVKKNGQTLGKKWMGLRVAMLNDGSVPQSNAALSRAAVLWLPTLICCFCLWPIALVISMLVDKPYKQGLHDKVAKTVVVQST
ncbi:MULTISPECIES: RDD family protein [unclassified Streptomyces]|uniref:RDD family protein n=1 Tax=unclassified Streptomyces TaxID=2593676 RepID=UPI00202E95B8|nr:MULTISPECIES: RDD family protein [unclassified Streptomyces]MCM1967560.1 RDD family protein [Streptomyces sp. G1]MCX5126018.1 RDD family protein [Streptomyces sp. NBC_00347]MCX5298183.1 RDD family protein [Streptomyces sp. NBC_00193]